MATYRNAKPEFPHIFAKDWFTRIINVTGFMIGTFDLFVMTCRQRCGTTLNPFLNGTKSGSIDGTRPKCHQKCQMKFIKCVCRSKAEQARGPLDLPMQTISSVLCCCSDLIVTLLWDLCYYGYNATVPFTCE